ncbi:accessory gene regulator B family protein [Enterococcus faecium]|uniref:Copper ABC transporter permease n=1 Tax=Enterococcus faecium TaxID=1352 RepID=A0A7V7KW67_ENTFC|nr:accessory gene regulator B family protein [Enterococcus faecium]KAA0692895.1 copper ABC transporter permease [Enterococcus faecium]MBK5026178.1 accessory gene regulator B family protein [Enterococcus faecium]MBK5036899.1 accessory gene regulator B family protein [Enterococcus faecium]MBK5042118.1 accessory gene regulator B family protein [Enterococcus faecium]MBK5066780.1 accessory gene regulator B family protein [Enterococcus faecium]
MPNEYLSLEEKLSSKMSRKLGEKYGLTELDEAKVNYGLAILFINLFKFMLIYVSAFFLHSIFAVITTHLSFIAVRRYAKGYHASRSMACTLYSMGLLVALPVLANHYNLELTRYEYFIGAAILSMVLGIIGSFIAQDQQKRRSVRNKLVITGISLTLIGSVFPANDSRVMILLGMLTAILLVFIPKKERKIIK